MQRFLILLVISVGVVVTQQPCCSQQPYILKQLEQISSAIGGENITVDADLKGVEYYLSFIASQLGSTQYAIFASEASSANLTTAKFLDYMMRALYQSSDLLKPTITNAYVAGTFPSANDFSNPYAKQTVTALLAGNSTSTMSTMFINYYNAAVYWFQQIAQNAAGSTQALVNTLVSLGYSNSVPTALITSIIGNNGSIAYWTNMAYATLFDTMYTVSNTAVIIPSNSNTTFTKILNAIMNQGYNRLTGLTSIDYLTKLDQDLTSANTSAYGLGFMFSNYYNAATYWLQSINTGIQSIIVALDGGADLSSFAPSYFLFLPLFGDITSDAPLAIDYSDYPNPGNIKNVVNGLEDLRIGSSFTNMGIGVVCNTAILTGGSAHDIGISANPVVLDLTGPYQELYQSTTFDIEGNPIYLAGHGTCQNPITIPVGAFITYDLYYYASTPKLVTMTLPGCASSDIALILSIKGIVGTGTLVPGTNYFTINLDTLIGYTDLSASVQWLTSGSLVALEAEWHNNVDKWDHWNCAGSVTDPGTVCNVTICLNPATIFRPSMVLGMSAFSNAPWVDNGGSGRFINNLIWPTQRGFGQIKLPVNPITYGVYTTKNNVATAGSVIARSESSTSGSLVIYLCSSDLPGIKLARGVVRLGRSTGERLQNMLVSYPVTTGEDVYIEWLDFEWDKGFEASYARFKWANFAFDTQGENRLFIVTELDTNSCFTTLGTEAIPQAFWAMRLEMLIAGE